MDEFDESEFTVSDYPGGGKCYQIIGPGGAATVYKNEYTEDWSVGMAEAGGGFGDGSAPTRYRALRIAWNFAMREGK